MPSSHMLVAFALAMLAAAGGLASFRPSASPEAGTKWAKPKPQPGSDGASPTTRTPNGVIHSGCGARPQFIDDYQAIGEGPARLQSVHCLALPGTHFSHTPPIVSPDASRYFVHQSKSGLHLGMLMGEDKASFALDPTFEAFTIRSPRAYAWGDRGIVWGVEQETAKPSGFAIGPLRPVRALSNGRLERLPALTHPAGTLDGMLWAGRQGLALAQFGTAGGYYRPQRSNPDPTLAFVDAGRGKVLQAASLRSVPKFADAVARDLTRAAILGAAAATDSRGRAVAVLAIARTGWLLWRQGERPRDFSLSTAADGALPTLTPNAGRLLVSIPLQPDGVVHCRIPCPRPTPTPRTGVVAALHDLASGKLVWATKGRSVRPGSYPNPAVSPDGRFALVGLPTDDRGSGRVGLIAMKDGRVLQSFSGFSNNEPAVGFAADGRTLWISGGYQVALYQIRS